jgi:MYXO-CTERM domain-containing protein
LAVIALLGWSPVALANHHHIGGGSSSGGGADDPDADCLRWGFVRVGDGGANQSDAAGVSSSDAGGDVDAASPADGGTGDGDAGAPAGVVLVCLEHATLFGCDCSAASAAGDGWSRSAVVIGAALLLAARRRRRARRAGGTS